MAEGYVFQISGNISKYATELAKIPGVSEKEAAQAAVKMGAQFAKMSDKAAKEAKKAASEGGKAFKRTADEIGGQAAKLRGALDMVGAGPLAGAVNDLADAAAVAGPELAALVGVGGGLAALAAAPVAAVAGLEGALVALTFTAKENLDSLKGFKDIGSDFYPSIPAATLASFDALASVQDALSSIAARLSVVLAASVAPAVEKAADVVVGLTLSASELVEQWAAGKNLFEEIARGTLTAFAQALFLPLQPLSMMESGLIALADLVGQPVPEGFRKAHEAMKAFVDGGGASALASMAVNAVKNSDALQGLGSAFDGAAAKGHAFIAAQERATAATKNSSAAATENAAALKQAVDAAFIPAESEIDDLRSAVEALNAAWAQNKADVQAMADAQGELNRFTGETSSNVDRVNGKMTALIQDYEDGKISADAFNESFSALADAQKAAQIQDNMNALSGAIAGIKSVATDMSPAVEKALTDMSSIVAAKLAGQTTSWQGYATSVASVLGAVKEASQNQIDSIDPKKHKAAYTAAFAAQKAAAIAQATLNTIVAVSNALAIPLPPPVPQIAAVAAGVIGGVQVAKIASTPPPKFHTGTLYATPNAQYRADEFPATLQRGEIVVDRQTAARPGVREGIAAMQAGVSAPAASPDDFAEGISRSGMTDILQQILRELRRPSPSPSHARPGHRPSYGY